MTALLAAGAAGPPAGYVESAGHGTVLVCRPEYHGALRRSLSEGTLHEWASRQPGARPLHGRGVAWVARLADGPEVVVRHTWHGGALARVTRDVFLAPTRAPHELRVAARLRESGVATPDVIAYATYAVAGPFCRADVLTSYVDGADLPAALAAHPAPDDRRAITAAVSRLLRGLWRAGARHADLNARNILVTRDANGFHALVLDVDRVTFQEPGSDGVGRANVERLARSIHKLRTRHGLTIADADVTRMTGLGSVDPEQAR